MDHSYLRSDNYMAGDIRRFIPIGSPFKGSPIADVVERVIVPSQTNIDELHSPLYRRLSRRNNAHLLPDWWYHQYPAGDPTAAPVNRSALTALHDLRTDSNMKFLLELPTYPQGRQRVAWYPLVGIASQDAGSAPVQAALWELLFANVTGFRSALVGASAELSQLSPANSDLVVSQWSQRNADGVNDFPNQQFPSFPFHVHTFDAAAGWVGVTVEPASVEMSVTGTTVNNGAVQVPGVAELLSAGRARFLIGELE